jgi:hypothetical protein
MSDERSAGWPRDPGDEPRPRPQYGEYATPEEQRARIAHPDPHVAQPSSPSRVDASPTSPFDRVPPPDAYPVRPGFPTADDTMRRARRRRVDRVVTAVMLAYGLLNVVFSIPSYVDLASTAASVMKILGVPGTFTNVAQANTWGIAAAVVLAVGYLVTATVSLLRLRAHRRSWWVPLVGVFVTYAVVYACVLVPLLSDPAFVAYMANSAG